MRSMLTQNVSNASEAQMPLNLRLMSTTEYEVMHQGPARGSKVADAFLLVGTLPAPVKVLLLHGSCGVL